MFQAANTQESVLDLTKEFMRATEWEHSFQLLDSICEQLISAHKSGEKLQFKQDPEILSKVSAIDSLCEKFHSQQALASANSDTTLSQYPWLFYDYYKAEYDYIKDQCNHPLEHIACFGHGAIPALAMVFFENNPKIKIDMFDIDPEVSKLAKSLIFKLYPEANINFITEDISQFASTDHYDLTIVTNAPLPYFCQRKQPFNSEAVFLRSSTQNGSLIYPRIEPTNFSQLGYTISHQQQDRIYGIHEWIIAARAP